MTATISDLLRDEIASLSIENLTPQYLKDLLTRIQAQRAGVVVNKTKKLLDKPVKAPKQKPSIFDLEDFDL